MLKNKYWLLTFMLAVCCAVFSTAGQTQSKQAQVRIANGIVKGKIEEGRTGPIKVFLGIPYAQAPVKALRWQAPQALNTWPDTYNATHFRNDCMQKPFPGDAAPLGAEVGEDCLYINVWTPANKDPKKYPVMVWIHGGGFVNGGSSPEVYNGRSFAESGLVFVSFNYRLGRFGFFAHPALSAENPDAPLGNYGFMDQIAALKWVKKNISQFNGDANNITLFGESAGGRSVNALMLSPLAKGLFHKAIVQSGGGRSESLGSTVYLDKASASGGPSAESAGLAFANSMGIAENSKQTTTLAKLRGLSAEQVVSGLNLANMRIPSYSGPMIDGKLIIENDEKGFASGHQMRIPYLVGSTDFEWGFLKDFSPEGATTTANTMLKAAGDKQDALLGAYQPFIPSKGATLDLAYLGAMMYGDRAFVEPARFLYRQMKAVSDSTWRYRFSYIPSSLRGKVSGAYHASEIPFAFDTVQARYGDATSREDKRIARIMHSQWVNFAKQGTVSAFQAAKKGKDNLLIEFNSAGATVKEDPMKVRLDAIENLY